MWQKSGKREICENCGSEKVFFVQHAHGNYPLLDYLCPKCELGEEAVFEEELEDSD